MERIKRGTIVKLPGGLTGVTVPDLPGMLSCCHPDETPVVFLRDGKYDGGFAGSWTKDLEVIGPEGAVADFKKCGAGQGAECCAFLTSGPNGPECERFSDLRFPTQMRVDSMTAKRMPEEVFPECQKFKGGEDGA